jgi:hypothetical protein
MTAQMRCRGANSPRLYRASPRAIALSPIRNSTTAVPISVHGIRRMMTASFTSGGNPLPDGRKIKFWQ